MSQSLVNHKVIVVFIAVVVGLLHFLTGPRYRGPFPAFVNGYMIDILLPFAMYLVLGVAKQSILRSGIARGVFVFAIGAITETLQYFGVPIFGRTFDWLDYLMFGVGIGLAVIFERIVLSRIPMGYRLGRVIAADRRKLISCPTRRQANATYAAAGGGESASVSNLLVRLVASSSPRGLRPIR